ncbi:MAG: MTAP family purine nucleoside phosphorylase [Verrucomicrobiota bacterium]
MIAFITGSGFYDFAGLDVQYVETPFGEAQFLAGTIGDRKALLLPRHGAQHTNLPNHINHQANLVALKQAGATAIVSLSVVGILDPNLPLGQPLVAKDIHFPDNRLSSGEICTIFDQAGDPARGHLLAESLVNHSLNAAIQSLAEGQSMQAASEGVYGHVNGPRFNTKSEIKALQAAGVDFISQTCGPEAVLANELELPYSLVCFGVDYANGVQTTPTPIEELQGNLAASKSFFDHLVLGLAEPEGGYPFSNFVYRFE